MVDSIFKGRIYFRKFPHKVALRIIRDIRLYNGWGFDCDDVIDGNNYIEYLYGILASLAKNDCYGDFEYDRLVIELKLLDYSVVYENGISRVITWAFPRILLSIGD